MVFHHGIDGVDGFFFGLSYDDAFAGSQAVGFNDDRSALFADVGFRRVSVGKGGIGCVGIWYFFMIFLAKTLEPSI